MILLTVTVPVQHAQAQIPIIDIIKAAVKKVIKQIDLQVQRLQNKTIALQNAQKTLENTMSKAKLKEISDWMEKQRKLYDEYYQELKKVKDAIRTFQTVRDIARQQSQIVAEYKHAYALFRQDKNFTEQEVAYMYQVYTGIMNESAKDLEQLAMVVSSFKTEMTDGKRLELIRQISNSMQQHLNDLRRFNTQNRLLSVQRTDARRNIEASRKLYALPVKP